MALRRPPSLEILLAYTEGRQAWGLSVGRHAAFVVILGDACDTKFSRKLHRGDILQLIVPAIPNLHANIHVAT